MKATLLTGVVGLMVGAGIVVVALWLFDDDPAPAPNPSEQILAPVEPVDPTAQVEAARAFLRDWLRFREATLFVRSEFERITTAGEVLEGETTLAQDPPNRINTRLGGIIGVVDGHPVSCLTPPGEEERCYLADATSDYDADVRTEIETMATYFAGPAPLYRIETSDECYEVVLTRYVPAAPYGFSGELCFDEATGALTRSRFEYERVTEQTIAVEILDEVPPDAFAAIDRGE